MDQDARRRRFADAARRPRPGPGLLCLLCLLVGAEADPGCDEAALRAATAELDRLAAQVAARVAADADGPEVWAAALRDVLGGRHGFHGRPSDYARLDSSALHRVLLRRRGLPILLSVVWIEVGRRAGAPVYGVGLPGHFVVGVGEPDGHHLVVDPFDGGGTLTTDGPDGARAADPLDIVARVLTNIRVWAADRPEQSAVGLWAVDLALLLPRHPARLRLDRARLLVERGEYALGASELESYADLVAPVDRTAAETVRRQARSARALLN